MKEYRGAVLALGVVVLSLLSTTGHAEEFQLKDPLFKQQGEEYVDSTGPRKHHAKVFLGIGSSDYSLTNRSDSTVSSKTRAKRGGGQVFGFEYGYEFGDTPKFLRFNYRKLAVTHRKLNGINPSSLDVARHQYWASYAWNYSDKLEFNVGVEIFDRGVNVTRPVVVSKLIEIGPKVGVTYKQKLGIIDSEAFGNIMAPVYFNEGIVKTGFNPFAYNIEVGVRGFYKINERFDIGAGISGRREYVQFEGVGERGANTAVLAAKECSYQYMIPVELKVHF